MVVIVDVFQLGWRDGCTNLKFPSSQNGCTHWSVSAQLLRPRLDSIMHALDEDSDFSSDDERTMDFSDVESSDAEDFETR